MCKFRYFSSGVVESCCSGWDCVRMVVDFEDDRIWRSLEAQHYCVLCVSWLYGACSYSVDLPMFLIYQPEDGQLKGPKHVVILYVINYTYLYHHIVVLDKYTHSNLVYYKHNGDDKPYDSYFCLMTLIIIIIIIIIIKLIQYRRQFQLLLLCFIYDVSEGHSDDPRAKTGIRSYIKLILYTWFPSLTERNEDILGALAILRKTNMSFVMSVCPSFRLSAWNNSATTGWMCQSHTGHMTGLWFLPSPTFKDEY